MTMVAHSFGGYLTSRYALKHPDRVNKIVFLSPHGTEPKPDNYEERLKAVMKSNWKFG